MDFKKADQRREITITVQQTVVPKQAKQASRAESQKSRLLPSTLQLQLEVQSFRLVVAFQTRFIAEDHEKKVPFRKLRSFGLGHSLVPKWRKLLRREALPCVHSSPCSGRWPRCREASLSQSSFAALSCCEQHMNSLPAPHKGLVIVHCTIGNWIKTCFSIPALSFESG